MANILNQIYSIGMNHLKVSALLQGETIIMEKNSIETPYAIIDFVRRKPLFSKKYDYVLNADKQNDNAIILFALGIGKDY